MGRYYNGDIEGKFWLGIQSSDDADNYGVEGKDIGGELEYYFTTENKQMVEKQLKHYKEELGEYKQKIEEFFKKVNGYNDEVIMEHGLEPKEFNKKLEIYARIELGEKILNAIEEKGDCYFTAEY